MRLEFSYIRDQPESAFLVADWYDREWGFPKEETCSSLAGKSGTEIPFHAICLADGIPVATAGLYTSVGLTRAQPRFQAYGPWLALVYTVPDMRGRGIGGWLCQRMEWECRRLKVERFYLFTFTAEQLYRSIGWTEMERLQYKGHDTVVMYKDVKRNGV